MVVTAAFVFHYRHEKIKQYTQQKLQGVVDQINDAQYYEYKFDKKQEINIKNLDQNVNNMYSSVNNLQNNIKHLKDNAVFETDITEKIESKNVNTEKLKAKNALFADKISIESSNKNDDISSINFNGKSRWSVVNDQRSDAFKIDKTEQDNTLHNYVWMSDGTVGLNNNKLRFSNKWTGYPDNATDRAEIANDASGFKKLMIVGNRSSGDGVRKVGVWDRLDVHGTEYVDDLSTARNVQGRDSVYVGDNASWMRRNGDMHIGNNLNVHNKLFFKDSSFSSNSTLQNNRDSYSLEKITEGTDNNHLRMTINDNPEESFQIWGDSCTTGKCEGPGALRHKFDASGNSWHKGTMEAEHVTARNKLTAVSSEIDNIQVNTGKVNRLQLGDKFGLSGVGDGLANDDWLRLTNAKGNSYYGGFATEKLWTAAGSVMTASDIRMKKDVANLNSNEINKITMLDPKQYMYKEDPKQRVQFGLIAQDVEKIYPNMVETGANGMKSLRYQDLIPILIGKVKDLENKACVDGVCLTKEDVIKLKSL